MSQPHGHVTIFTFHTVTPLQPLCSNFQSYCLNQLLLSAIPTQLLVAQWEAVMPLCEPELLEYEYKRVPPKLL